MPMTDVVRLKRWPVGGIEEMTEVGTMDVMMRDEGRDRGIERGDDERGAGRGRETVGGIGMTRGARRGIGEIESAPPAGREIGEIGSVRLAGRGIGHGEVCKVEILLHALGAVLIQLSR